MFIDFSEWIELTKVETEVDINVLKEEMRSRIGVCIQKKIDEYTQSLTIHGLTRGVKGRKGESVFWISMLLVGLLCVFVVIHGLIKKYNSHIVYTELKSEITDQNNLPSITFCEESLLRQSYFSYCGTSIENFRMQTNTACSTYKQYVESVDSRATSWETPLFNITYCMSWGGKRCDSNKYFKSKVTVNNSCITWNYNGDFHDAYSHVDIKFEFRKPAYLNEEIAMFAIPHDHRILEIDMTKKIEMDADQKYEIKIDKTFITRLPAPFPSNCTNDEVRNIFPGRYTRYSCIESHYYVEMYKKCGDVFDYHKQYIPKDIVESYKQNNTNVTTCLLQYMEKELRNLKHCQFACEILDLDYYSTFQSRHDKIKKSSNVRRYEIGIQLKTANEYRVMQEKPLYTVSQMACEIGGFVGLIMGMSVISLIEIMVIIVLYIAKRII